MTHNLNLYLFKTNALIIETVSFEDEMSKTVREIGFGESPGGFCDWYSINLTEFLINFEMKLQALVLGQIDNMKCSLNEPVFSGEYTPQEQQNTYLWYKLLLQKVFESIHK